MTMRWYILLLLFFLLLLLLDSLGLQTYKLNELNFVAFRNIV